MQHKKNWIFAACSLLLVSLIYSPFLLSVSMILLILASLINLEEEEGRLKLRLNKAAPWRFASIIKQPSFLVLPLFFLIVLFSFWQTEDYGYWLERLRIKLPFLLLPFVFLALPRFGGRYVQELFYVLLFILVLTSIGVGINYLLNTAEIHQLMTKGHPIPTPRNHIRYSLLLAYGILAGAWLYWKGYYWRYPKERILILSMTIFLFLFLHFLSVKTGILTFYAALFVLMMRYLYISREYLKTGVLLLGMVSLPVLGYLFIQSLNTKIGYMLHDLNMYSQGKGELYADAGRLTSVAVGIDIVKRYPLFGVGAGNLRKEVHRIFKEQYPQYKAPIEPHNQFLFVMAGTGLFGLVLFSIAFFYPLFHRKNYRHGMFLAFYLITFVSIMIEHGIENAVGVAFYLFFLLMWLSVLNYDDAYDGPPKDLPRTALWW